MSTKNFFTYFTLLLISLGSIGSSCSDDEDDAFDFPPIDRGGVEVNRMLIHVEEARNRGVWTTYEFYAPNGVITVRDTIPFRKGVSGGFVRYDSKIDFMFDNDTVTSLIDARDEKYIICYRNLVNSNLQVGDISVDKNGFIYGREAGWKTVDQRGASDRGTIRITLNYLPGRKENKCDTGIRLIEAEIPYVITN